MAWKGVKKRVAEIARELGVRYVLEGSVRKAGNNLRITAQLVDAAQDAHLWAEKYAGTLDDVFDIQEKVSRAIVEALRLQLDPDERRRMGEKPIRNASAHECYLRARHEIELFTRESLDRAVSYLEDALELVGPCAAIHAGLAWAHWNYVNIGAEQEEGITRAEEAAREALRLEPEHAPALAVREKLGPGQPEVARALGDLGFVKVNMGDYAGALKLFERALALDPDNYAALSWLGLLYLIELGEPTNALVVLEKLHRLEPAGFQILLLLGASLAQTGNYRGAIEIFRRAADIVPKHPDPVFNLGYAFEHLSLPDSAELYYRKALGLDSTNSTAAPSLAGVLIAGRRLHEAAALLEKSSPKDPDPQG